MQPVGEGVAVDEHLVTLLLAQRGLVEASDKHLSFRPYHPLCASLAGFEGAPFLSKVLGHRFQLREKFILELAARMIFNGAEDRIDVISCRHECLLQLSLVSLTRVGAAEVVEARGAVTVRRAQHVVRHENIGISSGLVQCTKLAQIIH